MNRTEGEACVRILLAVARASGGTSDEEQRPIRVIARTHALQELELPGTPTLDLPAEIRRLETPAIRRLTLRAALAIATLDGACTADEHRLLEHLYAAMGDGSAPLPALEAAWLARMVETRRAQDAATEEFLRGIGQAVASAELSNAEYEGRVAELERAKDDVVGRLLLSVAPASA